MQKALMALTSGPIYKTFTSKDFKQFADGVLFRVAIKWLHCRRFPVDLANFCCCSVVVVKIVLL